MRTKLVGILCLLCMVMASGSAMAQTSGFGFYDVQRSRDGRRATVYDYQTGEMIEAHRRMFGVETFNYGSAPPPPRMFSPGESAMPPPVFEGHRYGQEWKAWGNMQDD